MNFPCERGGSWRSPRRTRIPQGAAEPRTHDDTKQKSCVWTFVFSWVRGFVVRGSWFVIRGLASAPVAAEKRGRSRNERGRVRTEDRTVPAVRDDPQKRSRDRGVQLEGDGDRIEEIV